MGVLALGKKIGRYVMYVILFITLLAGTCYLSKVTLKMTYECVYEEMVIETTIDVINQLLALQENKVVPQKGNSI